MDAMQSPYQPAHSVILVAENRKSARKDNHKLARARGPRTLSPRTLAFPPVHSEVLWPGRANAGNMDGEDVATKSTEQPCATICPFVTQNAVPCEC